MIIGGALVLLSIFVILIGTKQSEASILYYDADYNPVADEDTAEVTDADWESDGMSDGMDGGMSDGLDGDEPAAVEDARPRVTVTVGGNAVNQKPAAAEGTWSRVSIVDGATDKKPADDINTLRNAASKLDPNKTAQAMFESLKGEKL